MKIDKQEYADYGLLYSKPADTWDEGLPLGNGILGGLVWGDGNPLKISISRTDLWDLRPIPEFKSPQYNFKQMYHWHCQDKTDELIRLYEAPYDRPDAPTRLPAGRIEIVLGAGKKKFLSAGLNVATASASLVFAGGILLDIILPATEAVGMCLIKTKEKILPALQIPPFNFSNAGKNNADISQSCYCPDVSAGQLSALGYPPALKMGGKNWTAFHQKCWGNFSFAVYLAWIPKQGRVEISWSVASSMEGSKPFNYARERVERSLKKGFDRMFAEHQRWWQTYWKQSSISIPDKHIERQWFLDQYKFGSAARRGAPPISLQGPWPADDGQLPPWKGDYHHDCNTELTYLSYLSANHLKEGKALLDWLWDTRENGMEWTRRFFEAPGLNVPMTADLLGRQMGGWRQHTHSATTSAWLAHCFYLYWRYTLDRDFLRRRAYPYIRDTAVFLEFMTRKKPGQKTRTLLLSSSPEINQNRPEAWFKNITNYDLSLIRWVFTAAAELAGLLGKAGESECWRKILEELPFLAIGKKGDLLVAKNYPQRESARNLAYLIAIHHLGLINWEDGRQAQKIISASLKTREALGTKEWLGLTFAWNAHLYARAKMGAKAQKMLKIFSSAFTLRNSFHCNGDQSGRGYSRFTYKPMTLEGNFAAAAAVQEMLLQSYGGQIRIFPAVPASWDNVSFEKLRAEGAFLVSAERRAGKTKAVYIYAEKTNICRLVSPFDGKLLTFKMKEGSVVRITA